MSDAGRMSQRLASSYREDDLRRAADRRRGQLAATAAPESEARSRTTVRSTLAAIGRLLPRLA